MAWPRKRRSGTDVSNQETDNRHFALWQATDSRQRVQIATRRWPRKEQDRQRSWEEDQVGLSVCLWQQEPRASVHRRVRLLPDLHKS